MALADQVVRDGDRGFTGFASRPNPLSLQSGVLQRCVNMRLDRGVAQGRKGLRRLAEEISSGDVPLTVPFQLAEDVPLVSLSRSGAVATGTTGAAHGWLLGRWVNVAGATGPDGALYNGDFALSGVTSTTFSYGMTGTPAADAVGSLVANGGPLVRAGYSGGIFAGAVYASERFDDANEYIALAGPNEAFLWREGAGLVRKSYPTGPDELVEESDTVSLVQAFDRLYLLREASLGAPGFGRRFTDAAGVAVSGTVATVAVAGHGYVAGNRVRIEGGTVAAFAGHEYDVASVVDDDFFTVTVPSGTLSDAVAGIEVRRVKAPLVWDGGAGGFVRVPGGIPAEGATYKRLRSVGWARFVNNRLVIPDGRNGVLVSDILDGNLYDPFWQSLRCGVGGDDFVVAVEPWTEGAVLVFCRKSIWLATVDATYGATDGAADGASLLASMSILTNEVGCVARRTIVRAGQWVFFLSDVGVYRLDTQLDMKLRGDTLPLSDGVADRLVGLDFSKAAGAVGVWHGNRYWLAFPTVDSPDGSNDVVLVWNTLFSQWESEDLYSGAVDDLLVSGWNSMRERRIYAVRRTGSLFLMDENEDGLDDAPTVGMPGSHADGMLRTRRMDFGELASKRFLRSVADVVVPAGGRVETWAATVDPDREWLVGEMVNAGAVEEDYHLKAPIRYKAHSVEMVYRLTAGRPLVLSVAVEASPKSLPATLTRNEE